MKTEWFYKTISLVIMLVLFYLFYKVLSPFIITIAWAMVLAITFYPLYRLILKSIKRPWLASLMTLVVILIIILGPFTYVVGSLAIEITDVYKMIDEKGFDTLLNLQNNSYIAAFIDKISSYKFFEGVDIRQGAVNALQTLGKSLAERISGIFKNAVFLIVNFIIMCLTTFYFLKDGGNLAVYIKKLLPFSEIQNERLGDRMKEMVSAAIYGGLAVGVAQGTLGGIAFFVAGLSSPVFWGTAMALLSLVPLFGCAIIWMPAGVMLLLSGAYAKGISILVFGALIISSVDTVLKPIIIGGRTRLHTLLVFFSVLGGINYLGFLGFILGPLIASLCLSLLEIYSFEETEQAVSKK